MKERDCGWRLEGTGEIRTALRNGQRSGRFFCHRSPTPHHQSGQGMLSGRSFRPLHRLFSATPHKRADPWPLPHTKQHMEATAIPPNIPKPIPIPRHNESLETLRARLTYQTRKRGTLESDLIMSTFAREHLYALTREELLELDQVTWPETEHALHPLILQKLIGTKYSCSTNPIGTCITGVPRGKHLPSVGSTLQFSTSLKFTPATRVRPFVACLISTRHSVPSKRTRKYITSVLSLRYHCELIRPRAHPRRPSGVANYNASSCF